jgi:hypothetical protein
LQHAGSLSPVAQASNKTFWCGKTILKQILAEGSAREIKFALNASSRIAGQRQTARQTADIAPDGSGNRAQLFEGWIALTPFHAADVTGISIRLQGQVFLGQTFGFASLADAMPQHLQ